jgi:hypothetical protein
MNIDAALTCPVSNSVSKCRDSEGRERKWTTDKDINTDNRNSRHLIYGLSSCLIVFLEIEIEGRISKMLGSSGFGYRHCYRQWRT